MLKDGDFGVIVNTILVIDPLSHGNLSCKTLSFLTEFWVGTNSRRKSYVCTYF